jgi:hypothetical protein
VPDRIPLDAGTKRRLRQEAGYGCCLCGNPLFEYQHIIEYSEEAHNRFEDMMLLCRDHHFEATKHVLSEAEQRAAKAAPCNIAAGFAKGRLRADPTNRFIAFGGMVYLIGGTDLITIDGERCLRIDWDDDGRLLVSLTVRGAVGSVIAEIVDNEWRTGADLPWDLEFGLNTLTIRSAAGRVDLSIDASKRPVRLTGHLWLSGHELRLTDTKLVWQNFTAHANGAQMRDGTLQLASDGGVVFSQPTIARSAKIGPNEVCWCDSGRKFKKCHGGVNPRQGF